MSAVLDATTRQRAPSIARTVVIALARAILAPFVVRGPQPAAGVVLAANHTSHADTLAMMRAVRGADLAPAAAEDYFFRGRVRRTISRAIGAFPFPRHGEGGLANVREQLRAGRTVLMFPEGTRSRDGEIGRFRCGVGRLASAGATIVPVGIAGTHEVLAKGCRIPRRAPVAVCFGPPLALDGMDPREAADTVEHAVRVLAHRARAALPPRRRTLYERVSALARSPVAPLVLFAWAAAEAVAFPLVPDVGLALLALAVPSRTPVLAVATLGGSLTGATVAYPLGATELLAHVPLVTDPMREAAHAWLTAEGAGGVAHQPWSGVPFKAFALQAADAGVALGALLWETALARGARFVEIAVVFATLGWTGRRIAPRIYAPATAAMAVLFVAGWIGVLRRWS